VSGVAAGVAAAGSATAVALASGGSAARVDASDLERLLKNENMNSVAARSPAVRRPFIQRYISTGEEATPNQQANPAEEDLRS
jgi:hypothetical protein